MRDRPSSRLTSTLGIMAIALGLGIAFDSLDWHGHQCDACGARWKHFGAFNGGAASAHTCSECGALQWWKDSASSRTLRAAHCHRGVYV